MTLSTTHVATWKDFNTATAVDVTPAMITQAIETTQITGDSILELGNRRDTSIPDIMKLAHFAHHTVNVAAPKGHYHYCQAEHAILELIADVKVIILRNQKYLFRNTSGSYAKVYLHRHEPVSGAHHLGRVVRVNPGEQVQV